jgi:hypothetical protein
MGLGHHFSRVSYAAGPVVAARVPFRAPGCACFSSRGSARGGGRLSKWGRFPIARPRALGDAGSNRKEREMKGSIVCAGKDLRISRGALDR